MERYFLDTSAIVKRYVAEQGHIWVRSVCRAGADRSIYIAESGLVEVVASPCRMARAHPPRLTEADHDRLIAAFRRHCRRGYNIVPVDRDIFVHASNLCRTHPLRAYDAVQLACTLQVRDDALAIDASPPTFVYADVTLSSIAVAEGLATDDRNAHP